MGTSNPESQTQNPDPEPLAKARASDLNPGAHAWQSSWKIERALTGGGQGDTWVVESLQNPTLRGVLKCLKRSSEQKAKARRRMFQEVSNLRVLHGAGANVPKVLDDGTTLFETNQPLFFVMEVIEGRTLAETVENEILQLEPAINVALGLCDTLKYAAKERVVHRDIKPENIIVRSLSPVNVVMVDFGVARNEADGANVTEIDETFDNKFLSLPERRGPGENKRDPRSDLPGICAILLYCLTKCVPRDLQDSSMRPPHRRAGYTLDPVASNPIQRALLNAFFDRAFKWELDARFQTVDEIISRLREILNPPAVLPAEDLTEVANRESARLKAFDRVTQLAGFRQSLNPFREAWGKQVNVLREKITRSRFYVMTSNYNPEGMEAKHGDRLESFFAQVGVFDHNYLGCVIAYHFCSSGPECSIVRAIYEAISDDRGATKFQNIDEPSIVVRYAGDAEPPFDLVIKDSEAAVASAIRYLRGQVERKAGIKTGDKVQ